MFIGLIIIFILSFIDQEILFKFSIFAFCLSLILLILVPIVGIEVKGSKRWLDLIILPRLQPIELLKPFFIIILSLLITNEKFQNL